MERYMKHVNTPINLTNAELKKWVSKMAELCKPSQVYWCNGSDEEYNRLCNEMVESGTFIRLNPEKGRIHSWPGRILRMWPG
ncbi:hypothetical protein LWM68_18410 [Niabella sp. W65]|nr:hypothetical protein [Niabella sp. W65]MCH7364551.1 hypothetical protein [Niabella sp. W65]